MAAAGKIGILTFHRCINYGSYWQARSLAEGLQALGRDTVLLDHESRRVTNAELRCAFQPQLPHRTARSDFPLYAAKTRKFLAAFDALPLSPPFPLEEQERLGPQDTVVVGSDEVWNLQHPWYGGASVFYGEGLTARRLVSYAASFGNHDADAGLDRFWEDKLARFDAISVRDENSRRLVAEALGCEPDMVLDPCLQFPPSVAPTQETQPYIAVYGHSFPDWFAQAVARHGRRSGLRLVSIGYRNDWADEQRIEAGPHEFAALIAGASAVATNFFHGCVFALLNGKPFLCASSAYRSNKVRDLTASLGAARHLVGEGVADAEVEMLLTAPLDPVIPARIAALRTQSSRYLQRALA